MAFNLTDTLYSQRSITLEAHVMQKQIGSGTTHKWLVWIENVLTMDRELQELFNQSEKKWTEKSAKIDPSTINRLPKNCH